MDDDNFDIKNWRPKVLCLGSGGIKGINMLGALYNVWMLNMLEEIDCYVGSSVGAVISALMICGWSPPKIMEQTCEMTLFKGFEDVQWTKVMDEFGLFPNSTFDDRMAEKLRMMITEKFGRIPSLLDLYKITGKRLIIIVVSLKEEREIAYDHINNPDLNLLTALRMTSNTPLIFGKLAHQEDYFVDGAIINPFPINHVDDGVTPVLGIGVQDKRQWKFKDMTFMGYYERITSLPLAELTNYAIANASDACVCSIIPVSDEMSMLDDGKDVTRRILMFQDGYRFMEQFLENYKKPEIKKFNSKLALTESVIRGCLDTTPVKLLMKCIRENPELLLKSMPKKDRKLFAKLFDKPVEVAKPVEKIDRTPLDRSVANPTEKIDIKPPEKREKKHQKKQSKPQTKTITKYDNIMTTQEPYIQEINDDDIIELPRMDRNHPNFPRRKQHFYPSQGLFDSAGLFNNIFQSEMDQGGALIVQISIDPKLMESILGGIGLFIMQSIGEMSSLKHLNNL